MEYRKKLAVEGPTTIFMGTLPVPMKQVVFDKFGENLAYNVIVKEEKDRR